MPRGQRGKINLASHWYQDPHLLQFDTRFMETRPVGWYLFTSAPGLVSMRLVMHGTPEISIAGKKVRLVPGYVRNDGAVEYQLHLDAPLVSAQEVILRVAQQRGYYGGAAFSEPIRLTCGKGLMGIGDWSQNDGLHAYSGGARYSKTLSLSAEEAMQNVELDLGSVVSTAEVWVNGRPAGVKTTPPWVFEISGLVREGGNHVEILVYNTASNHYTSIPTRYRGSTVSGMLGPVTIRFTGRAVLREQ
jgi:hypothetical protein